MYAIGRLELQGLRCRVIMVIDATGDKPLVSNLKEVARHPIGSKHVIEHNKGDDFCRVVPLTELTEAMNAME